MRLYCQAITCYLVKMNTNQAIIRWSDTINNSMIWLVFTISCCDAGVLIATRRLCGVNLARAVNDPA